MTKVPSLGYEQVVKALQRHGFVVVRQRESHVRLQRRTVSEVLKIIVPGDRPTSPETKPSTSRVNAYLATY